MLSAFMGLVLVFSNVDVNAQDIYERKTVPAAQKMLKSNDVPKSQKATTTNEATTSKRKAKSHVVDVPKKVKSAVQAPNHRTRATAISYPTATSAPTVQKQINDVTGKMNAADTEEERQSYQNKLDELDKEK